MSAKLFTFRLTGLEAEVAREALNAALAGEWADGDFSWTQTQADAADRALSKLGDLLGSDQRNAEIAKPAVWFHLGNQCPGHYDSERGEDCPSLVGPVSDWRKRNVLR